MCCVQLGQGIPVVCSSLGHNSTTQFLLGLGCLVGRLRAWGPLICITGLVVLLPCSISCCIVGVKLWLDRVGVLPQQQQRALLLTCPQL